MQFISIIKRTDKINIYKFIKYEFKIKFFLKKPLNICKSDIKFLIFNKITFSL